MGFPVKKYRVIGKSMEPTFKDGDTVFACDFLFRFSRPKKGNIVVISHPIKGIPIIKRIRDVENDSYFLEGDNVTGSSDSNDFGWIERKKLLGKVFYALLQ